MKSLRLAWLKLRREWRAGEHVVLLFALLVAVSSLTAVSFFTSRVERAMAQRANEILAADLRLQSSQPPSIENLKSAQSLGLKTAEGEFFNSVIVRGDASSISTARAMGSGYPLRGRLKISDQLGGRVYETDQLPAQGEVWAEPRLLQRLSANVGDELQVGRLQLKVSKVLESMPDQGSQFTQLAPTILLRPEDVPATALVGIGSRVQYVQLFAGPEKIVAQFDAWLKAHRKPGERLETLSDASPQLQSSIERAAKFLNLTALSSVLLAGVAVAMAARRYAARHLDNVALMKSLGAPQSLVLGISVYELGMLGIISGALGTALGFCAQLGIAYLSRNLLSGELPSPSWNPVWLGMLTPLIVLAGFALPPLLQLKRVPPVRVLRHNALPPRLQYFTVYGIATAAVVGLLIALVHDLKLIAYTMLGTIATIALLAIVGGLLVRSLGSLRRAVGVSWRYGVANIARRGRESVVQLVAFGLGLMVLLLLFVVRNDLLRDWRLSLPDNAPNQFLINIAPDRVDALTKFFVDRGVAAPTLVPMIRARLVGINGEKPAEHVPRDRQRDDRARGFLEREANLSWAKDLQEGNKIVAGKWWSGQDTAPLVSVEKGIADTLGLKLGDRVTYDAGGEQVTATVASFREVRWDSFKPNFFMVFSPGVLDKVIGTYITSVHLAHSQRNVMVEFYREFPEVTAIDIDALLTQIRGVMDNAAVAIQYVFAFSLLAGISVLLAAVQATRDERRYESAMLRTLGATRRTVLQGVAAEFVVLGVLAGVLGALAASAVGYYLATEVFNLSYHFDFDVWWIGLAGGVLLVGTTGIAVTRSVVNVPPMESLRAN